MDSSVLQESARALGTDMWRVAVTLVTVGLSVVAYRLVDRAAAVWAARTENRLDDDIIAVLRRPFAMLLPLAALTVAWPQAEHGPELREGRHAALIATIVCMGWFATRLVRVVDLAIEHRFDRTETNNLHARRVHTQLRGFRNIVLFMIGLATVAAVLMTFDAVRQFGISLLASAGVAGVIIGFAAQRSISTIIAGVQIALSQPIRVDDVVIVENEWGWIEEIALTYVVVRIWDQRRLVVPINYFIERPFQNWTRSSAEILGTVFLYVDYCMPIEPLRLELRRLCGESRLWDRRVCQLVVTEAKETVVELRALVSAEDSGKAWDLRCEIREGLLRFIQAQHPEGLPRVRVEPVSVEIRDDASRMAFSSRSA